MFTIKVLKTMTKLLKDGQVYSTSKGRSDHLNHILAWCDESGIQVTNDPRFSVYRGTYCLHDGGVIRGRG